MKFKIFLVLACVLMLCSCGAKNGYPKEIDAESIDEIIISNFYTDIILTLEDNPNEIEQIVERFNQYKMHKDQKSGTTHPIHVVIVFDDNNTLTFSAGVGDFITSSYNDKQYNLVNKELNDYIEYLIDYKK